MNDRVLALFHLVRAVVAILAALPLAIGLMVVFHFVFVRLS